MNKKLVAVVLIGIALLGSGFYFYKNQRQEKSDVQKIPNREVGVFEKGKEASDVTLLDFDGYTHTLSSFEGEVVILDYWAAWCPFCVEEMPILQEIHEEYEDVVVIGVHRTDTESKDAGLRFAENRGAEYLLVTDRNGDLYNAAGGFGMPVAVYIDKEGVVREIKSGPKTKEEIVDEVEALLNQ